jgi:hypothetical protein
MYRCFQSLEIDIGAMTARKKWVLIFVPIATTPAPNFQADLINNTLQITVSSL